MKNIDGVAYFSENYLVDGEKRADGAIIYLFIHTEILQIPEELFSKSEGNLYGLYKQMKNTWLRHLR